MTEARASLAEPDDAEARLVARLRAGDEQAFEQLVARFQAPLFRYLRGLVADAELAEDLLQETFLRAFRAIGGLSDPAALRGWLYRIAHNQAITALRRRSLVGWLSLGRWQQLRAPEPSTLEAARVEQALAQLPAQLRAPLLLHLVAGFSYAEVADLLSLSEPAVRMRISRARAAFRAAYAGDEDAAP